MGSSDSWDWENTQRKEQEEKERLIVHIREHLRHHAEIENTEEYAKQWKEVVGAMEALASESLTFKGWQQFAKISDFLQTPYRNMQYASKHPHKKKASDD